MNFAILGVDEDTRALARAAIDAGHQVLAVYDPQPLSATQVDAWAPGARIVETWEALIGQDAAEAVIVGRARRQDEDARTDQLRTLIQAEVPLLVVHPVVESMLVYYELDMYRQDSQCPLLPYFPGCWHPAIERLAAMVAEGDASPIGQVQQLVVERWLADRSRGEVVGWFVRDAHLARRLCGELNKIGGMASPGGAEQVNYANLAIQMSGPSGIVVRWSVGPIEDTPGGQLTLVGTRGKAVLHMPENDADWKLELRLADKTVYETYDDWDPEAEGIEDFLATIGGEPTMPTWLDACRDLELADAIERSVRRGRTIDLFFEEHTEHGTFKGMMAAGGCLLLMLALGVIVVATTAGNLNLPGANLWPFALLAVLIVFLLLQLLKFVFPGKQSSIRDQPSAKSEKQ